jgi:hypothetical protein
VFGETARAEGTFVSERVLMKEGAIVDGSFEEPPAPPPGSAPPKPPPAPVVQTPPVAPAQESPLAKTADDAQPSASGKPPSEPAAIEGQGAEAAPGTEQSPDPLKPADPKPE